MGKEASAGDKVPKKTISGGLIFAAGILAGAWGMVFLAWLKRADDVGVTEARGAAFEYVARGQRFFEDAKEYVEEAEAYAADSDPSGPGAGH